MSEISYESYINDLDWVETENPEYLEQPPKGFINAIQASQKWNLKLTAAKTRLRKMVSDGEISKVLVKEYGSPTIKPYYGKEQK